MLSNFHSHCTFCDGRNQPEDFIISAISEHFRAYGFSSHSPLPFETFWNMSASKMPEYLKEIDGLKKKYKDQIEIYTGLEIDYLDETYNASIPYFQSFPLDYRIGSLHFIPLRHPLEEENMVCIDGPYENFEAAINKHYQGEICLLVKEFFNNSMQMVEIGGFDIVGHMDKIYMNGIRHPDFDMQSDLYRKLLEDYTDLIAEKGLIVEINTKNYSRSNQTYPHIEVVKLLHKKQIPIQVNSDSHHTKLVNNGRNEILSIVKEIGFRVTRELVKGTWQDMPIT